MDAALALGPRTIAWLDEAPADAEAPVGVLDAGALWRKLGPLRGSVLVVAAELACVTPRTLRALLRRSRREACALFRPGSGKPLAIGADARTLRAALDPDRSRRFSLERVARRLAPVGVVSGGDDELVAVASVEDWGRATRALRRRKMKVLLRKGVLVSDPEGVLVDPDVTVGPGTVIHPWVRIEGRSRIAANCVIGSFTHIVDSSVGAGTTLHDHCYIRESRVGREASIGPFAHLRPASDVGDEARIGNFVELKKVRIGKGAKAPHLSYVGDAAVGSHANLGAGTITCNFDGREKHRTFVGDGAFIGSDVQLVAPVRVGKGAYVAAGSCIVEDVPPHALALARSRQVVKKGWATRRASRGKRRG